MVFFNVYTCFEENLDASNICEKYYGSIIFWT